MAWTETYHCDVCNSPRNEAGDWWLAWSDLIDSGLDTPHQPLLRLTPWSSRLSQSAEVKHLCGARCAQTMMDRWMRGEGQPQTLRKSPVDVAVHSRQRDSLGSNEPTEHR